MTQAKGAQWNQLTRTVKQRGSITPPELAWVLQELAAPAPSLPPDIPSYLAPQMAATRHLELMGVLWNAKNCTPPQREQIYQATQGYLSAPERNDKLGAMAVMRTLKNSRAISRIKPLLNDPDEMVRTAASKTLTVVSDTLKQNP